MTIPDRTDDSIGKWSYQIMRTRKGSVTTICKRPGCGFKATGTQQGEKPHVDDELCRMHRTLVERNRQRIKDIVGSGRGRPGNCW